MRITSFGRSSGAGRHSPSRTTDGRRCRFHSCTCTPPGLVARHAAVVEREHEILAIQLSLGDMTIVACGALSCVSGSPTAKFPMLLDLHDLRRIGRGGLASLQNQAQSNRPRNDLHVVPFVFVHCSGPFIQCQRREVRHARFIGRESKCHSANFVAGVLPTCPGTRNAKPISCGDERPSWHEAMDEESTGRTRALRCDIAQMSSQ